MDKERYYQIIIDEAYKNYCLKEGSKIDYRGLTPILYIKENFINKCKTDPEFSEKWGLKIEERELGEDERYNLCVAKKSKMTSISEEDYVKYNIPTKQITLEYNNEKIEIYE